VRRGVFGKGRGCRWRSSSSASTAPWWGRPWCCWRGPVDLPLSEGGRRGRVTVCSCAPDNALALRSRLVWRRVCAGELDGMAERGVSSPSGERRVLTSSDTGEGETRRHRRTSSGLPSLLEGTRGLQSSASRFPGSIQSASVVCWVLFAFASPELASLAGGCAGGPDGLTVPQRT
jgi:hypothetical protein